MSTHFAQERGQITALLAGARVQASFAKPLLVASVAALAARDRDAAQRLVLVGGATSYARTIGFEDALAGREPSRRPEKGRSYSALARLEHAEAVEQASEVINEFIYDALADHQALATRIARVVGELHDNVASHAKGVGFSAAQLFDDRVEIAIADAGVGMLRNVQRVRSDLRNDLDAVRWCLEKGNTTAVEVHDLAQWLPEDATGSPFPSGIATTRERVQNHHIGEGLWQLGELVRATRGALLVWSGTAQVLRSEVEETSDSSRPWQGVAIGLNLPLASDVPGEETWSKADLEDLARRLGIE